MGAAIRGNPVTLRNRKVACPSHGVGFRRIGAICRDNGVGYAEAYQDVIHADANKTTDGTKAPDYCFRIGGTRKFFLEARHPSVDIKNDVSPAFQLRRYGLTEAEITIVVERNEPAHPAPPAAGRISRRHRTT